MVFDFKDSFPTAVFKLPDVLDLKAYIPKAVLLEPEVLLVNAS